jgi:hypothetical protein
MRIPGQHPTWEDNRCLAHSFLVWGKEGRDWAPHHHLTGHLSEDEVESCHGRRVNAFPGISASVPSEDGREKPLKLSGTTTRARDPPFGQNEDIRRGPKHICQ